jgi:hypothetical protein
MGHKEKQKIEIEKLHRDPLPPLNQAVTADYSDFLGTLKGAVYLPGRESTKSLPGTKCTRCSFSSNAK